MEGGRVSSSKLKRSIQSTLMPRGIDPLFFSVPPQPHSTDSRSQSETLKRRVHDDKKRQSTLFTRSVRRFPPPGHLPTHVYPGAPYYCELPATRHPFGYKETGGSRPPAISPGGRETKTAICCGTSPRRNIDGRFSSSFGADDQTCLEKTRVLLASSAKDPAAMFVELEGKISSDHQHGSSTFFSDHEITTRTT